MGQVLSSKTKKRVTPAVQAVPVGTKTGPHHNECAVTAVPVQPAANKTSLPALQKATETFKATYVDGSTQAQCDAWNALVEAFVEWYGAERCKDDDAANLYDAITGLGLKTKHTVELKNDIGNNALFRTSEAGVGAWEGGKHVQSRSSQQTDDAQERWKVINTLATYGSRDGVQELIRDLVPNDDRLIDF